MADSPFGRYLEQLELSFDAARKLELIDDGVWRFSLPTARNLSVPRAHLERIGLFDERFRTTCEDQDLAHRAEPLAVQYLYDESISCVHNDQASDLRRYGSFSERGAADTALFCRKHPEIHGSAEIARVNGPIRRGDRVSLILKKALKRLLAGKYPLLAFHRIADLGERAGAPDKVLFRLYRLTIGLHIQRGWIKGVRALKGP